MEKRPLPRLAHSLPLLLTALFVLSCQGTHQPDPVGKTPQGKFKGVLMWKGDPSENGLYANEITLTTANVNVNQFGRVGHFQADGIVMAQPLFISGLDNGEGATHDVVIIATEHDSVYAIDAQNPAGGTLWERHYVDPAS